VKTAVGIAMLFLSGVAGPLAAVAVSTSLFADCVLAARNDAEDVRNVVAGFAAAWNRHDLDAFGKLFAPDADFVNVAGDLWTGRQSIQAQHAYTHGVIPADSPGFGEEDRGYYGIFRNSTLKFDQIDVRLLSKEAAVAHVKWKLLGDARTQNPRRGVFMFVLTRQDVGWLIAAAQNTEISRAVK
jgi:ketosteroid isomerase-like protein